MSSSIDEQWDFINPPTMTTMAATGNAKQILDPRTGSPIELTIDTELAESVEQVQDAEEAVPKPRRKDTTDYFHSEDEVEVLRVPRLERRAPPLMLRSSAQLLENLGYDGIANMASPSRSSIYLATYPFTEGDVKKWSWLFSRGAEDQWLTEGDVFDREGDYSDVEDEYFLDSYRTNRDVYHTRNRNRRNRDYLDIDNYVDVGSVYLSRALDVKVIPEKTDNVTYLVVVQGRSKRTGIVKLLTAESRKGAGMLMFYEALAGNSIVFVGAVVGGVGKKIKKFRKAQGVEDAITAKQEGFAGVIC